ncbi:MAG: hypothetical protein AAFW81_01570 [Pseudomonadota bacterium]
MLSTARVSIPAPVSARLKSNAAFHDNVNDLAREDLIGFNRPIAAAFAVISPVAIALVYQGAGFDAALQLSVVIFAIVGVGLYLVGRAEWPGIVAKFEAKTDAKKKAAADLRCGFGESSFLSNGRSPHFIEHEHGVLVLADAGDLKTLFFDISNAGDDQRWELYAGGELNRRIWRWLRLPVSREIVKFTTEGSRLNERPKLPKIASIDAWEAVNVALGEPLDGAIIHRPFDELVDTVERLVK